jgi:thioredoxin-related protein
MKNLKIILVLTIALLAFAVHLPAKERQLKPPKRDANGIDWYDYEAGWEKAKAENKHMFVDFTATWCGWCKRLEANTFSQTPVIKALTDDFVPVKVWEKNPDTLMIDGLKITSENLRLREFGATSFPQLWFVSPKGVRVGPVKGYVQAEQLLQYFEIVKTYSYDSTLDESGNPINPPAETEQPSEKQEP